MVDFSTLMEALNKLPNQVPVDKFAGQHHVTEVEYPVMQLGLIGTLLTLAAVQSRLTKIFSTEPT